MQGAQDQNDTLHQHKSRILKESSATQVSSFVVIGQTLHKLYYEDKLMKTQKEFLEWTKANLGFSKSTTYEYIISYRVYMEIANKVPKDFHPPMYQSHCQLLSKVPEKKLVETWMDVCKQAPGGVITTAFLETYLDKHNLKGNKTGRISMQASEPLATLPATYGDDEAAPDSALHSLHLQSSSLNGDMASSSSSNLSVTGAGSASFAKHPSNNTLPFNEQIIFELSKQVVLSSQFDMVLQSVEDFQAAEHKMWAGAVWANLASVRPLTTKDIYSAPPPLGDAPVFEGGLEHLLRIVFTKFASKEFAEGVFLLRAEFGADWFSPILQHPFCILRHTNVPAPIEIPIAIAMEPLLSDPLGGKQPAVGTSAPSTTASSNKRQKRGSGAAVDISAPAAAAAGAMASTSSGGAGNGGTRVPSPPAQATACVQPPFESYVMFYLGPNVKEFCSVFRSVALVPGINSWCAVVGPPPPTMGSGSGMSGAMSAGGGGSGNLGNDM